MNVAIFLYPNSNETWVTSSPFSDVVTTTGKDCIVLPVGLIPSTSSMATVVFKRLITFSTVSEEVDILGNSSLVDSKDFSGIGGLSKETDFSFTLNNLDMGINIYKLLGRKVKLVLITDTFSGLIDTNCYLEGIISECTPSANTLDISVIDSFSFNLRKRVGELSSDDTNIIPMNFGLFDKDTTPALAVVNTKGISPVIEVAPTNEVVNVKDLCVYDKDNGVFTSKSMDVLGDKVDLTDLVNVRTKLYTGMDSSTTEIKLFNPKSRAYYPTDDVSTVVIGDKYLVPSNPQFLAEVLDSRDGYLILTDENSTITVPETGTLTKYSGSGPSTIAYTFRSNVLDEEIVYEYDMLEDWCNSNWATNEGGTDNVVKDDDLKMSTSQLPATCYVKIDSELLLLTSNGIDNYTLIDDTYSTYSYTSYTCQRAVEDTSASSHAVDSSVIHMEIKDDTISVASASGSSSRMYSLLFSGVFYPKSVSGFHSLPDGFYLDYHSADTIVTKNITKNTLHNLTNGEVGNLEIQIQPDVYPYSLYENSFGYVFDLGYKSSLEGEVSSMFIVGKITPPTTVENAPYRVQTIALGTVLRFAIGKGGLNYRQNYRGWDSGGSGFCVGEWYNMFGRVGNTVVGDRLLATATYPNYNYTPFNSTGPEFTLKSTIHEDLLGDGTISSLESLNGTRYFIQINGYYPDYTYPTTEYAKIDTAFEGMGLLINFFIDPTTTPIYWYGTGMRYYDNYYLQSILTSLLASCYGYNVFYDKVDSSFYIPGTWSISGSKRSLRSEIESFCKQNALVLTSTGTGTPVVSDLLYKENDTLHTLDDTKILLDSPYDQEYTKIDSIVTKLTVNFDYQNTSEKYNFTSIYEGGGELVYNEFDKALLYTRGNTQEAILNNQNIHVSTNESDYKIEQAILPFITKPVHKLNVKVILPLTPTYNLMDWVTINSSVVPSSTNKFLVVGKETQLPIGDSKPYVKLKLLEYIESGSGTNMPSFLQNTTETQDITLQDSLEKEELSINVTYNVDGTAAALTYSDPDGVPCHITQINDTVANIISKMDKCQIGIGTSRSDKPLIHKDENGTERYNLSIDNNGCSYLGDPDVDGTVRFKVSSYTLLIQKRVNGTYDNPECEMWRFS